MEVVVVWLAIAFFVGLVKFSRFGRNSVAPRISKMMTPRVRLGALWVIVFGIAFGFVDAAASSLGINTATSGMQGTLFAITMAIFVFSKIAWNRREVRMKEHVHEQKQSTVLRAKRITEEAARKSSHAQLLREEARIQCETFYHLHHPEIGNRFPRPMFDDFVNRYMDDNRSPNEVHDRAKQLLAVLEGHLHRVEPPREKSLETIVAAFENRKHKVRAASIDSQDQELLLMQLDAQREEAIRRAMAEGTL